MAKNEKKQAFRTSIGGQALIEGILMRGPEKQAIVVRAPEGLVTKVEELKLVRDKYPVLGLPVIRGVVTFLDSMVKGIKALMFSADYFPDEEAAKPSRFDLWLEKHVPAEKLQSAITIFSLVLSLALSLGLFMFLPTFVAGLFRAESALLHNLIEGVIKILIFFAYLFLCSRQKDVHRIFQYHGAEHKTIFCYEAGLPLTVENARVQPRHHPRCGTSFLFGVIVVSILFSSILLMLIPIVGLTYEFNRFVGRHDNAVTRILSAPGMWLQNFTTFEPDDSMLEVAIESLKLVLPQEQGKDKW